MFDTTKLEFQAWWHPHIVKALNADDHTLIETKEVENTLKGILILGDFNQRVSEAKGIRLTRKIVFDGAGNPVSIETSGV